MSHAIPRLLSLPEGHILGTLVLVTTVACGGGGTEPPSARGPLHVSIVAGDAQSDTIDALLATPIRIRASYQASDGSASPAAKQLVNFVVVEPNCGRPYAGSAVTDADGYAIERWQLGTKPGLCHMEVRSVDQQTGQPISYATASATIAPGATDTLTAADRWMFFTGTTTSVRNLVWRAVDRHGNTVTHPAVMIEAAAPWGAHGDSVVSPTAEDSASIVLRTGSQAARVPVSAVRDLRQYQITTSLHCGPTAGHYSDSGQQIDSLDVPVVTVDSIHYGVRFGDRPTTEDFGYVVWSGDGTFFLHNGTSEAHRFTAVQEPLRYQGPASITWMEGNWDTVFRQSGTDPLTYRGDALTWCYLWGASKNPQRTMTITMTPRAS